MSTNTPEPIVSIIVPVYNAKKYLKNCITSILSQTYHNLEIILIDDGSTDNSSQLVDDYAKSDSRIKTIHQKNTGLSGARNAGLKIATGKYITFVDSDDQIAPNMIEKLLTALRKSSADIAVCSFQEIYPNGKTTGFSHQHLAKVYSAEGALSAMLQEKGFMVSVTMKLFPTEYFKNLKFPVGKLHEDVATTYKLIMQASRIVFIPDELYIYVHHDDSIISKEFNSRKLDLITFTDQMCSDIDTKFPKLKNITNERRMRARFSILRQIPIRHPETKSLLNYLKMHKTYITKNPVATSSDKIALKLALIHPKLLQLAYKLFK